MIEGSRHENRLRALRRRFKQASPGTPWSASLAKFIQSNIGLIAIAGAALLAFLIAFETDGAGLIWATASIEANHPQEPHYRRCADARAAGVAPILRGQPGYRSALDADNDDIACEPDVR